MSKNKNLIVIIVEHKAIDIYRANKRRNIVPYSDEILNEVNITAPEPEVSMLGECILKLSPRYREVILLKYYQGLSSKEIAKYLDISLSNAIKIEQRAKKKLMEYCKEAELL